MLEQIASAVYMFPSIEAAATAIVGHVGDGNFHVLILYPSDQSVMLARATTYVGNLVKLAISMGAVSGLRKKQYLATELVAEAVATMVLIKRAMGPQNILNPDKVFDLD